MGERVFLRHPVGADRSEYLKLREASEAFLRPWEPTPPDAPDYGSERAFDNLLLTCDMPGSQRFVLCGLGAGEIMGQISLNQIFRGPFQSAIAGYWVGEAYARRGYMADGLRLTLRHAFERLGLHRVEANIIPVNEASKRLVRRVGFRYEGLALRYLRVNGAWQDHEHWAMTAEEWPTISAG